MELGVFPLCASGVSSCASLLAESLGLGKEFADIWNGAEQGCDANAEHNEE